MFHFAKKFAEEISLIEHYDWSVGQCLQTSNEVLTTLAFQSLFPMWKISKFLIQNRIVLDKFPMWKGP